MPVLGQTCVGAMRPQPTEEEGEVPTTRERLARTALHLKVVPAGPVAKPFHPVNARDQGLDSNALARLSTRGHFPFPSPPATQARSAKDLPAVPLSENLRGILLMCASMAAFTINDTFMKSVTQTLPLYQSIGLRGTVAIIGLMLLAIATGAFAFRPSRRDAGLILLRSLADVAATILFLEALIRMPLANLSAILQALPLLITLGAALVYGDRIGWRRMTAILVGLAGVLIIIRPGTEGFDHWALLGVGSTLCVVVRDLSVRPIRGQVPSALVALGAAVGVTAMGWIGTGFQGWHAPTTWEAARVVCAGLFLIVGYLTSVSAMRHGDIGIVAPFRYTSLLWAIMLGLFVFGDLPDGWTMLGAAIVVAAGIFTLLRERRLKLNAAG